MDMPTLLKRPVEFDVPDFAKPYVIGNYTQNLIDRIQVNLILAPSHQYIAGTDGILVPTGVYDSEVRPNISRPASLRSNQLVQRPTEQSIDNALALALQDILEWVPEEYQQEAIGQVEAVRPEFKYADTPKEAALALGLQYEPKEDA